MSAQTTPIGMDLSPAAARRHEMVSQSMDRLQHLAYRSLHIRGQMNDEFVIVCIEVDSRWRGLVDKLMPNANWQPYRDAGQEPVAQGAVTVEVCALIAEECPEVIPALKTLSRELPPQKANCVALDEGGCTVYEIDAIQQPG